MATSPAMLHCVAGHSYPRALRRPSAKPVSHSLRVTTSSHRWHLSSSRASLLAPLRQRRPLHSFLYSRRPAGTSKVYASSIEVTFVVRREVQYGETLKLVGNHDSLGNWKPRKANSMQWNDGHVWISALMLEEGTEIEFKCVKASEHEETWEDGNNRKFKVPRDGPVKVEMKWGKTRQVSLTADDGEASESTPEPQASPSSSYDNTGSISAERGAHEQWAGKAVEFMTENRHSKDRTGTWDVEGLEGAALTIVDGDSKAGSWLQKLQVVKKLLVDDAERARPEEDALVNASAYLLWINTGAIMCAEGGGHYRPNRHAELSRDIFRSLEWTIGDDRRSLSEKLVARRLHTRLPSFAAEFTASVPLTRIRDIAHRNDIPHDLKREIKHTLQNKLHRNAGPEDLVAAEQMLHRIEAGDYNPDFVREFQIFFHELKDFFNANSLTDMLSTMDPSMDSSQQAVVHNFLGAKAKVDSQLPAPQLQDLMEALHCGTTLRAVIAAALASGLRNDSPEDALAMRQTWRLAEIRAEEYCFMLLSTLENSLEMAGGYGTLGQARDRDWALPIGATVLGLRHMALSGWNPRECAAIEADLEEWQRQGFFTDREPALRLKSTLERAIRLTEEYASCMLALYPERVTALGTALGVEQWLQNVYTEAEIRAGVVFQLSKLATLLLKASRVASGSSPWDVVVSGAASGKLLEVDTFDPAAVLDLANGQDIILLVKSATGDEEVSGTKHLKGIILQQDIAHLSHLGVRARQEGVTFATCEDEEALTAVRCLVNGTVTLTAGADGVQVTEGAAASKEAAAPPAKLRPRETIAAAISKGNGNVVEEEDEGGKGFEVNEEAEGPSGSQATDETVTDAEAVRRTIIAGVEIIQNEGGKDSDVLTFSFCEDAVSQVMNDEELLALVTWRHEAEAREAEEEEEEEAASANELSDGGNGQEASPGGGSPAPPQAEVSPNQKVLPLEVATVAQCGAKASACARLIAASNTSGGSFEAPGGAVLPFGVMEAAIEEAGMKGRFDELLSLTETTEMGPQLDVVCEELQHLVASVRPNAETVGAAADLLGGGATIARSSANVEDLAGMSGAGLYDSVPNRGPGSDPDDFCNSVSKVWASLYTRRAVLARRAAAVPQASAAMAVLLMPLLEPESSFVLHTTRPVDKNTDVLYAEVAPGQGEVLASGGRGTPWRLNVDKFTGAVETSAFANFSEAFRVIDGRLRSVPAVYSKEAISLDTDARKAMGKQLMEVGVALEKEFGGAQDIEGAFVDGKLFIVQSRPQP